VQTQRLADDMRRRSPVPAHVVVIPNPLHPEAIASPPFTTREPVVIGLGRLVAHKRYHELIMAFARVAPEFPAWRLRIIGSGPEHSRLCALAEQLNVASRVDLPGAMNPPWPELHRASVLVHCAEIEGFCNTIIEGLASGCAVVSSDCSYGPREILQQGAGYLYPVGDIDALCVQLRLLLGNDEVRIALAREGHASIDRFSLDTNVSQWMQVVLTTPTTSARAS
jgi:GalNAc-alpha-(1->4)-GalNAc-alpha-(1->3)-diNAcBac-PP-undecaprenol alpha-1,4-N-acetyl-D-galactosaminyltransferase